MSSLPVPLDIEHGNIAGGALADEFVNAAAGGPDADAASRQLAALLVWVGFITMLLDLLLTAFYREPSVVVVFRRHKLAYYLTLAGIFASGVAELTTAFCLSRYGRSSGRVRAAARVVLCVSVVPLVGVIAIGGFAAVMKS
jgi:hypothetical protein